MNLQYKENCLQAPKKQGSEGLCLMCWDMCRNVLIASKYLFSKDPVICLAIFFILKQYYVTRRQSLPSYYLTYFY